MELTAKNVEEIFTQALFTKDEDIADPRYNNIMNGEAVMATYGFNGNRLEPRKEDVRAMLMQLPDNFFQSKGGGWSFLQACMRSDGVQWGEHRSIDMLVALGNALGLVKFALPRDMWEVLPGGMPYFIIID